MATKRIYTAQEAEEALKKMPQEARALLYSQEMRKTLTGVGEKHALHLDQLAGLEQETVAAMLGFTEMTDYVEMLSEALNIDEAKAAAIAKDMNDLLFTKIRETMKRGGGVEKSVVMPSSIAAAPKAPIPQPSVPPTPPKPVMPPPMPAAPAVPATPSTPKPPMVAPDLHPAEVVLKEKTLQMPVPPAPVAPKAEAPKPGEYKADPYREPIE